TRFKRNGAHKQNNVNTRGAQFGEPGFDRPGKVAIELRVFTPIVIANADNGNVHAEDIGCRYAALLDVVVRDLLGIVYAVIIEIRTVSWIYDENLSRADGCGAGWRQDRGERDDKTQDKTKFHTL